MADLDHALRLVLASEGGYSFDLADPGGETWKGISRRYHPRWEGWPIVDALKGRADFEARLAADTEDQVREFYHREFWGRFCGDDLSEQKLADELLDIAVNLGPPRAIQFLQRSLNCLNRAGSTWSNIEVDGVFGGDTERALTACLQRHELSRLLTLLNVMQGSFYISRYEADERNERFIGWIDRCTIMHK